MNINHFQLRHVTLQDLNAIYHIVAQQNVSDFGSELISLKALRERWQAADFSLAKQTLIAILPDGEIVGYAESHSYGRNQFTTQLYLSTYSNAFEIGQKLLTSLEAGLPVGTHLMAHVSGRNVQNQQIFAATGYAQGFTFLMMEIELTEEPPTPKWPKGIAVRPFQSNQDEQTTYAVDEEASLDKGYAKPMSFTEWAKRMSLHTERFDPTLWLLACRNEEVVGVSLNFYLPERNYGLIDHLGVRRAWRGQGIGLALLQQSFAIFFARGITKIKLNVDSGSLTNAPRLYEKAGMKTVHSYHIFSKTIS